MNGASAVRQQLQAAAAAAAAASSSKDNEKSEALHLLGFEELAGRSRRSAGSLQKPQNEGGVVKHVNKISKVKRLSGLEAPRLMAMAATTTTTTRTTTMDRRAHGQLE